MYNLSQVAIQRVFEGAPTRAYLYVIPTDTSNGFIINEENYLKDILLEELRYVPEQGIIGGVVARRLSGNFNNIDQNFSILDREMILYIGVDTDDAPITEYVEYGTFIVQRPTDDKVNDNTYFEALDYMCRLNLTWEDRLTYPCTIKELYDDLCEQSGLISATTSFRNMDFIIENNQFTGGESRRDVLRAIAQIAFSWARINEQNQICIDFDLNMSDSSSKNKFNKNNFNKLNNVFVNFAGVVGNAANNTSFYIPCLPNTTYTISRISGLRFRAGFAEDNIFLAGEVLNGFIVNDTATNITITSGENDNYLFVQYMTTDTNEQEILNSMQIEFGDTATEYTPFGITQVITNDEYKDFKSNPDEYGPVNVIILRNSQVEGENITIRDEESILAPKGNNILNLNKLIFSKSNVNIDEQLDNSITFTTIGNGSYRFLEANLGLLNSGTYYVNKMVEILYGDTTNIRAGLLRFITRDNMEIGAKTIKDVNENVQRSDFVLDVPTNVTIQLFISGVTANTEEVKIKFYNLMLSLSNVPYEPFVPNGETELVIADNPFAYTQAKRTELVEAGRALFGLRYMPISASLPIGFFWLNNTDKLRFSDMLGRNYDTFLFNHTIQYIGVTTDEVETPAQTSTETKYQFLPTMQSAVRRTEIIVDKHENQITSLTEETTKLGGKLTIVEQKVDGTQTSVEIRGGNNKIKNSPQVFGFADLLNQNTQVPITGYIQGFYHDNTGNSTNIRVQTQPMLAVNAQRYIARIQSNPNIEMYMLCYKDDGFSQVGTQSSGWSGTNTTSNLTTISTDKYVTIIFRKIDVSNILIDEVVSLFPTLEYGLDNSGATTITDTNISQFTVSKVGVKIIGTMIKTGIDLTIGQPYTLSMLYSNTAGNAVKIEIVENNTVTMLETTDAASLRKIEHTFTATGTSMEIRFYSAGETFFYADLMLNEGDTSLPWQPSIGETIGVVIQMNYDGLTVSSYLSATRTIMDANGFRIVDTMNNLVLRADSEKVLAKNIESQGYIKTGKWRQYTQTVNGYEHFILVRED